MSGYTHAGTMTDSDWGESFAVDVYTCDACGLLLPFGSQEQHTAYHELDPSAVVAAARKAMAAWALDGIDESLFPAMDALGKALGMKR